LSIFIGNIGIFMVKKKDPGRKMAEKQTGGF